MHILKLIFNLFKKFRTDHRFHTPNFKCFLCNVDTDTVVDMSNIFFISYKSLS